MADSIADFQNWLLLHHLLGVTLEQFLSFSLPQFTDI